MAASFNLTSGVDTLACAIDGTVAKAGAAFGTWSVADDNGVTITDTAANVTAIPVSWQFNAGNQLEILQAGAAVFNFHADAATRPDMAVTSGVLQVAPDQNNEAFVFSIHGDWNVDGNFDLIFTPAGGAASTIDGLLQDTDSSEFVYIFLTQAPAARHYEFDFTGKWQQNGSGTDVDFLYDKENGATGQINLPPGLTMDPVKNFLVYTYDKGTHTGSLELAGTIRVNSNFSVTYILDQQDDAGIQSTTFSIAATIVRPGVGEGNLKLLVTRTDGQQTLEIGGNFHGAIAGLDLTVGFTYDRTISGTTISDSVAFNGTITNPANGDQFGWTFTDNQGTFTVDLTAHIALADNRCLNAALNVTVNGNQLGVSAVFGISTNCGKSAPVAAKAMALSPRRNAIAQRTKNII